MYDPQRSEDAKAIARLTPKQLEVLDLLSRGYRMPEIAKMTRRGYHTVRSHSDIVRKRMNASTAAECVGGYLRHKLNLAAYRTLRLELLASQVERMVREYNDSNINAGMHHILASIAEMKKDLPVTD